jgi:hypothetical protein
MALRTSDAHNTATLMAPPVSPYKLPNSEISAEADRIADAIIRTRKERPFGSAAEIAEAKDSSGRLVFGNRDLLANRTRIHRTDSAAEESFARVFEASTVRSRNFRIWIIAQSLSPSASEQVKPQVLAEVRRAFTIFADPGKRKPDGSVDPLKIRTHVIHETDF